MAISQTTFANKTLVIMKITVYKLITDNEKTQTTFLSNCWFIKHNNHSNRNGIYLLKM